MAAKKRFLLRVDPQLYDALQHWASDELRSVNAQIEFLLHEAARKAGRARRSPEPEEDAGEDGTGGEDEDAELAS
ncbi:MAG: hypothetical protein H6712_05120 [Myxococcales bacterium]|nr:hypothetical protein [Myxococcales bacterium]